jgi:ribosomal protein S18 acetylase RimI-like enzyme
MPITADLTRVREILETDRVWSAFALADLTAELAPYCEWHVADDVPALVLLYRGFDPPLFFSLGREDVLVPLIGEVATEPAFYVSILAGVLERLAAVGYHASEVKSMRRMVLAPGGFCPPPSPIAAERLGPGDYSDLVQLFKDGEPTGERPGFFHPRSMQTGVFFGIREGDCLVAAAGTHVCAPGPSSAAIGNVYTRRDRRGRGLAVAATAAVAAELLNQGIRTIALNVDAGDHGAIRIYQRLGFIHYCDYLEARVSRMG